MADPNKDIPRVNERIRARELRVIGSDGEQLGVMTPEDAREKAEEEGLDLVEVSPNAQPPVCRIMDYGKYKYEQKKKRASNKARGKGHVASLREIKLRPRTDEHDLEFKLRKARGFLMEGDKVKVTLMFRGREIVHKQLGRKQLDKVTEMLSEVATVENLPRLEGRFMFMILVPNREGIAEVKRNEKQAAKEAASASGEASAEGEVAPETRGKAADDSTPSETGEKGAAQAAALGD